MLIEWKQGPLDHFVGPLLTNSFQLEKVYGNGYKGNTTQHNVEKVYNNSYKGEEITLTTFSTLWLRTKQIQEFTTKPSCFIFFINALQRLRGLNEIFVCKSFAFPLFQLVENMILCKSGKYWKEIDALERNWGNRWCSDIDGAFMQRIPNVSPSRWIPVSLFTCHGLKATYQAGSFSTSCSFVFVCMYL